MLAQIGVMLSYVWPWLADVGAMLRPGQAILGLYDGPFGLYRAQVGTWGHVGSRWGHVGPMSAPIGIPFSPPSGQITKRNWSVLQKLPFRLGESVILGLRSGYLGIVLGPHAVMLGLCSDHVGPIPAERSCLMR